MPIDGINLYQPVQGKGEIKSKGTNLGMDDFFKLLVAQLSNQDMFNNVDDTQFIAQMAQFSMVQALSDLSQASATAYSVSLIGKEATVATASADGQMLVTKGIVDSVILYNGSPQIMIEGEKFPLTSVMEVREPNIILPNSGVNGNINTPAEKPEEVEKDQPGEEE